MADSSIKKELLLTINRYKRSQNNLEKALELCNNPENNDDCLSIIGDLENHLKKEDSVYNSNLYQKCLLISQNIRIDNSRKN